MRERVVSTLHLRYYSLLNSDIKMPQLPSASRLSMGPTTCKSRGCGEYLKVESTQARYAVSFTYSFQNSTDEMTSLESIYAPLELDAKHLFIESLVSVYSDNRQNLGCS